MTGYYGPWGRSNNWSNSSRSSPATPTRATPTRSSGDTPLATTPHIRSDTAPNTPIVSLQSSPFDILPIQSGSAFAHEGRPSAAGGLSFVRRSPIAVGHVSPTATPPRLLTHVSPTRNNESLSNRHPCTQIIGAANTIRTHTDNNNISNNKSSCSSNNNYTSGGHNSNCSNSNASNINRPLNHCSVQVGPPDESEGIELLHTATTKHYVASMSQTVGHLFTQQQSTSTETMTEDESITESNQTSPTSTLPLSPQSPRILLQRSCSRSPSPLHPGGVQSSPQVLVHHPDDYAPTSVPQSPLGVPMHQYVLHQMQKPPPLYQHHQMYESSNSQNYYGSHHPNMSNIPLSVRTPPILPPSHGFAGGFSPHNIHHRPVNEMVRPIMIPENQYISRVGFIPNSRTENIPNMINSNSSSSLNSNPNRRSRSSTPGVVQTPRTPLSAESISNDPFTNYLYDRGQGSDGRRKRQQDRPAGGGGHFEPVRIAPPPPSSPLLHHAAAYSNNTNNAITARPYSSSTFTRTSQQPPLPAEVAGGTPTIKTPPYNNINNTSRRYRAAVTTHSTPGGQTPTTITAATAAASSYPAGAKHVASLHFVPTPLHASHLIPCPPPDKESVQVSDRSYTSVNLRLRQPSSDPQPAIDIKGSGSSLTYSTSSLDRRRGSRSSLQISIGPSGGSVSAMRTNLSTEVKRGNTAFHIQYRAGDDESNNTDNFGDGGGDDDGVDGTTETTILNNNNTYNINNNNNNNVLPSPKIVYRSPNSRQSSRPSTLGGQRERPQSWYVPHHNNPPHPLSSPSPSPHHHHHDYSDEDQNSSPPSVHARRNSLPVNARFLQQYYRDTDEEDISATDTSKDHHHHQQHQHHQHNNHDRGNLQYNQSGSNQLHHDRGGDNLQFSQEGDNNQQQLHQHNHHIQMAPSQRGVSFITPVGGGGVVVPSTGTAWLQDTLYVQGGPPSDGVVDRTLHFLPLTHTPPISSHRPS